MNTRNHDSTDVLESGDVSGESVGSYVFIGQYSVKGQEE